MEKIKNLMILLLAFCLLLTSLTSCQAAAPNNSDGPETLSVPATEQPSESELCTIKIFLDFPDMNYDESAFRTRIGGRYKGFNIAFETAAQTKFIAGRTDTTERDIYLTHLRTEIMAGKGPDVFVSLCTGEENYRGLFPFPVQAMNNRLFLPLDDYIQASDRIEWDKLFPLVMEKGRNEEGQQLVPLTYAFPLFLYDKEQFSLQAQRPMTWDEMRTSSEEMVYEPAQYTNLADLFGEPCDYDKDAPAITEEELFACCQDYVTIDSPVGETKGVRIQMVGGGLLAQNGPDEGNNVTLEEHGGQYTMLPIYNLSGGVTANITTFAAINRNTEHPEEAFMMVEYLLSRDAQQHDDIFKRMLGMPVHMEVCSMDAPMDGRHMSEENFREFSAIRDQVNAVKFATPVDEVVNCAIMGPEASQEQVHKQYVTMQMMLAES